MFLQGGGETDLEKENTQLRETTRALRAELEQGEAARQEVDMARRSMAQMSLNWEKEKAALHVSLNIADEKLRLYENLTTTSVNETMECLKVTPHLHLYGYYLLFVSFNCSVCVHLEVYDCLNTKVRCIRKFATPGCFSFLPAGKGLLHIYHGAKVSSDHLIT